jgi:hypothetical protein
MRIDRIYRIRNRDDRGAGPLRRAAVPAPDLERDERERAPQAVFTRLSDGGQLLIWGIRHWMVAMMQGRAVPVSVARSLEAVGGASMYRSLTEMVLLAARDADRPLVIHPPCCHELSADEASIVRALSAYPGGATSAACVHLRALIGGEPSGALGRSVQGVARAFHSAGLRIEVLDPRAAARREN